MNRHQERSRAEGFCVQILIVNGEVQDRYSQKSYDIENIGKGGFRLISDFPFELEDRVQVLLRFPDNHVQEVLGRICYSEEFDGIQKAYGFSIIRGFYSLPAGHKKTTAKDSSKPARYYSQDYSQGPNVE